MEIVLENFTKRFGEMTVIENMNLKINEGEMLALLGPSGCGKSTTLFAICGIHKLNGGSVYFDGQDVTLMPTQQRNIGVVFQSFALYPHMPWGAARAAFGGNRRALRAGARPRRPHHSRN